MNSLYKIKDEIKSGLQCRIVIIDSLPPLFTNTEEYNVDNNIFLNHLVCNMYFVAMECHVAFVITNLLTTWTEGSFEEVQSVENVACGKYWISVPHHRLKIVKVDDVKCEISVLKSCEFALNKSCSVTIADQGII